MMKQILIKLLNLSTTFRIKLYPRINRMTLKAHGVVFGKNLCVPGKVSWLICGGQIKIGDNFYFPSGDGVNPIASNLQGAIFLENGASLIIGNNVGMSSTRMWVHDSVTIGDNVKVGACVLITDTDAHPMNYEVRRTSNEGTKSAPIAIEDDVCVGAHSIILKGVTIGARSIIGAGSVVTKSIPADCVAAGNPCMLIKSNNI